MANLTEQFSGVAAQLQLLLKPRFVMRLAMSILSFAMVDRLSGLPSVPYVRPADMNLVSVWSCAEKNLAAVKSRVADCYESVRLVYFGLNLFRKEEVFAPLIFAAAQQPHEVPAGMKAERPRQAH